MKLPGPDRSVRWVTDVRPRSGDRRDGLDEICPAQPDDIADFHSDQVRPAANTIVIAGDLDDPHAAAQASLAFTTWHDDRPAPRWTPSP